MSWSLHPDAERELGDAASLGTLAVERAESSGQNTWPDSAGLLDILAHPNRARYPKQRILVVALDGYAYLVPYVEEETYLFLKTIIPSRKATRDYLNLGEADAEH